MTWRAVSSQYPPSPPTMRDQHHRAAGEEGKPKGREVVRVWSLEEEA